MTKARDIADFKFENIVDTGTEGTKVASGTTAQRGSTTGQLRFNSTTGLAEYYDGTNFKSIDSPPTVSSISPTTIESAGGGTEDIVITGSNFASGATVKAIANNATEVTAGTVVVNSATQITATFTESDFSNSLEPYDIKVTNVSGLAGTLADQLNVDNAPTWSTASGSLGSFSNYATVNVSATATDAEGDTITYSVQSGSLPSGLSLNSSTGAITGTLGAVGSSTTTNFTLRATAASKTADRAFSITNTGASANAFSYTGSTVTWTKPTGLTSVTAYVWGAGGGGGGNSVGVSGGSGGYAKAVIDVSSLSNLYLVVGQGGFGGGSSSMQAGSGGGLSGIFDASTINHGDSILIAGSGGGGSGAVGSGAGAGGYGGGANSSGNDGTRDTRLSGEQTEGRGGSTSAGGAAGNSSSAIGSYVGVNPTAGSGLTGGNGSRQVSGGTLNSAAFAQGGRSWTDAGDGAWMGGAGGSGYYGGGGGTNGYAGGGGGGSGYAKSSVTSSVAGTNGTQGSGASSASAPETSSAYYASGIAVGGAKNTNGGNGRIVLVY